MAERRVAEKPLDPEAVRAANAAVADETGGRPIGVDEAELRKKWMDAYIAAGGKVKAIESRGREPGETCESCPDKKLELRVVELEYLSDHNVLKDNNADWSNSGSTYPPPDWTPGTRNPISHSMDEVIEVKVVVEGGPEGSTESGRLIGKLEGKVLFDSGSRSFSPGTRHDVLVQTQHKVRKLIRKQAVPFDWLVSTQKSYRKWTNIGKTTTDLWYTTFDRPIEGGKREDGATLKRMDTAVKWVGRKKTLRHSVILDDLFSRFDRYVLGIEHLSEDEQDYLDTHPDLKRGLADAGWPAYFNAAWGSWPIAEYPDWGGECQAICRFVLGMLRQVGSPADVELVYVAADFSDPETPVVRTDDNEPTGPNPSRQYALADAAVTLGRTYWPPKPGEQAEVGWNRFEAYLRYTYTSNGGEHTRWYGGGVGLIPAGSNPLHVFYAIVEYEWVSRTVTDATGSSKTESGRKVTGLHKYRG